VTPGNAGRAVPSPPPGAVIAAPPGGRPAYNATEPVQRYTRPAPTSVPPGPAAVTSAPGSYQGRVAPQTAQEVPRGRAPIQREGTPPLSPAPQGAPVPRSVPPGIPAAPRPT